MTIVTRNGKSAVIVVDAAPWERTQKWERTGNFADFLLNSPLRGSGLKIMRLKGWLGEIDL